MVKCAICGRSFNSITNTHLKFHDMTMLEYKIKFPEADMYSEGTLIKKSESLIGKNVGNKRPDLVEKMTNNNPMKDKKVANRMGNSRKRNIESGKINVKELLSRINDLPSECEKKVICIFDKLNIPMKYVGDGSFLIGCRCPDFINEEMKIVIELDINGNFSKKRLAILKEREEYFLSYGYKLIYLHEYDEDTIKRWVLPIFEGNRWGRVSKKEIVKFPSNKFVYNMETSPNNNYFANGMLVHNCFAFEQKSTNPAIKDKSLNSINVPHMIKELDGTINSLFYRHFYKQKFVLHWGGLADPFCNFELHNFSGFPLIEKLGELNYPTLFSTKGSAIVHPKYLKLWDKYADQKNFAFQISMVTADDDMSREVEVDVPPPSFRFKVIKEMSDRGFWTVLRLRPFIIGITDESLDELLDKALKAGINAISMEFLAIKYSGGNEGLIARYNSIGQLIGVPNLEEYFAILSPPERGGYRRLNRHIKEPFVKKIYKFCQDHNLVFACSDPDFKEINMSGSCCGLPDKYPANPLLENWTKNQLTYHLKELRKAYHLTGECGVLELNQVYGDAPYLFDHRLAQDHPIVKGRCTAERKWMTQYGILQEHWNNLNSSANPRHYFHGKLMPCGYDREGNLRFQYTVSEYEADWVQQGIDLTK